MTIIRNLLPDPSFELEASQGTSGTPVYFTPWQGVAIASVNTVINGVGNVDRLRSYHLVETATATNQTCGWRMGGGIANYVPVTPGTLYGMQANVNIIATATQWPLGGFGVRIRWYDITGTNLNADSLGTNNGGATGKFNLTGQGVAPAGAAYAELIVIGATSGTIGVIWEGWIDCVGIYEGGLPTAYFDGHLPNAYWCGTPDNSVSQLVSLNAESLLFDPTPAGLPPSLSPSLEIGSGNQGFQMVSIQTPTPPRKRVTASSQDTEGNLMVETQYDERTVTIVTRATPGATRSAWYAKLAQLQKKIAKLNAEGGQLMRALIGSDQPIFFDIVDAEADMDFDNVRYALRMDAEVTVTLQCRPIAYGQEVAMSQHTEPTLPAIVFTETTVDGDVPANGRLVVTGSQSTIAIQNFMFWGLRSRYYDPAATARLYYEAEALTPLDAAATFAFGTTASGTGNDVLRHNSLPAAQWCPVMATDLKAAGGKLTHKGTYRVIVRVNSTSTTPPQLRLQYGLGDFTNIVTNGVTSFALTGATTWCLADLGVVRLGTSAQWSGVIQALATTQGDNISVDCVFLVPADECSGQATAVPKSSPLGINVVNLPSVGADNSGVGTIVWSNPGNVANNAPGPLQAASIAGSLAAGNITHYLVGSGFGFAIPSTATISGIIVTMSRTCNFGKMVDSHIRLMKAGAVIGNDKALGAPWAIGFHLYTFGSATDLWGTTWLPADINAANFGVAMAGLATAPDSGVGVDWYRVTVYYTTTGAFTDTPDAVFYGLQSMQIASNGVTRQDSTGTFWVPEANYEGDYLKVPVTGLDGRTVEVIVKGSRSDPTLSNDVGIDDVKAQLFVTPRWLTVPDL